MQRSILTALAALSTLLLFGCGGAVSSTTTEPEPEPQLPAIAGTWRTEFPFVRDEVHGRVVRTLTFTESRFVLIDEWIPDNGTAEIWHPSGSYRIESDSEMVRISAHRDEDDMLVTEEFRKSYELVGDDMLRLEDWLSSERRDHLVEYERVAALPSMVGTWVAETAWQNDEGQRTVVLTLTLEHEGTYSAVEEFTRVDEGETNTWVHQWSGRWQHEVDELFILLTESVYTREPPCESDSCFRYTESFEGSTLRLAYAPTDTPDLVMVSFFWNEMDRDLETNAWVDDVLRPYGWYGWEFNRN